MVDFYIAKQNVRPHKVQMTTFCQGKRVLLLSARCAERNNKSVSFNDFTYDCNNVFKGFPVRYSRVYKSNHSLIIHILHDASRIVSFPRQNIAIHI